MKTQISLFLVMLFIAGACRKSTNETTEVAETAERTGPALTQKWETDTLLTTCESVLYDAGKNTLYVSNIVGSPEAKDGNGFISRVSLDGEITDLRWATGLDAPKGMGLRNNSLFVTDIDKIVEIDTETGKVIKSYPITGAQFLNDITVDSDGVVYATDSNVGFIVQIADDAVSMWAENLPGPNGILADGEKFWMAGWDSGTLNAIDPDTKAVTKFAEGMEHPDGIVAVGDGSYLVSTWDGMAHHVDADGNVTLLLDTRESEVNAADIEFVQARNLLLVPTFFANKVVAYELTR